MDTALSDDRTCLMAIEQQIIPFFPAQESGQDVLGGGSPLAMNVVIDAKGVVRRRPGIASYVKGGAVASAPIVGLHTTSDKRTYAFSGNLPGSIEVYRLQEGGALNLTSGVSAFTGSTRPVIAETEAILAVATSRAIQKIALVDDTVSVLGGTPPQASHVIAHATRLLANDPVSNRTLVNYSAPALGDSVTGHEQWGTALSALGQSGFVTAESRPDEVVAIVENSNEVFAFGTNSLQIFLPDASLVYSPTQTLEYGCAAPFGIVKVDQAFMWLDDRRRIVYSDGRAVKVISDPIKATLEEITKVDDCFGYRILQGPIDVIVWTFPSDGRSFAFQIEGGWSTWASYNEATTNWSPLGITSHTQIPGDNTHVVGLSDGTVGQLRLDQFTDLGTRIPAFVETGFLDRGSDNRKHCRSVKLVLRRGTTPAEGFANLQYRDTEGAWSSPIPVSLGAGGDRELVVEFRSLGVYRRRQWRFTFHANEELALARVTEEFDVLSH